ncbi:MAG: cysteine--tRNA ligase [Microgenomates group bacterium]
MIKLYNTLTQKKEIFKPIKKGEVGIYSCGPTVYWNQHIGHMYAYTQWDVLVRFLRWMGYKVKWVMNITDVGHLTSDADTGEDKMEKGAKREGLTVWQLAEKYIAQFLESLELLNISRPDVLCRATEHISQQIELIKKIEKRGFTYKTKIGLVFDTSKFPDYPKFARLNLKKQLPGARLEVDPEKKSPWDFYLWIYGRPNHIMQWDSPWGRGFPGWHIECTAMSTYYLGEKFDIHTGGKEHIPIHHTNEIAQGYGAFGRQTANFWLHNDWLRLKGEKMSKSKGNIYTIQDLVKKGFHPLAFRYLVLTSHYRGGLDFDWENLKGAQTAYFRLIDFVKSWQEKSEKESKKEVKKEKIKNEHFRKKFITKLSDDLNIPEGLAVVWELVKADLPEKNKLELIIDFDKVLGLNLIKEAKKEIAIPLKIKKLLEKREKFRQEKKWKEADLIRKQIEKEGWRVEDTPEGVKIKKLG